jgi:F0F1-type ATP synthase delta subunit
MKRLANTYKKFLDSRGVVVKPFLKALRKSARQAGIEGIIEKYLEKAELTEYMVDVEVAKEQFHRYVKRIPDFEEKFGVNPFKMFDI